MNVKSRISIIADHFGLSIRKLEEVGGFERGKLSSIKETITSDKLSRIIDKFPEIDIYWLITGEGNMLRTNGKENATIENGGANGGKNGGLQKVKNTPPSDGFKTIIIDLCRPSDTPVLVTDDIYDDKYIRLPAHLLKPGQHLYIKIKSEAMAPTLQPGGYLIIRKLERDQWNAVETGGVYVVTEKDGQNLLRRITNRMVADGKIICHSDNADKLLFPDVPITPDQIEFIWEVELYLADRVPNKCRETDQRLDKLESKMDVIKNLLKKPSETPEN